MRERSERALSVYGRTKAKARACAGSTHHVILSNSWYTVSTARISSDGLRCKRARRTQRFRPFGADRDCDSAEAMLARTDLARKGVSAPIIRQRWADVLARLRDGISRANALRTRSRSSRSARRLSTRRNGEKLHSNARAFSDLGHSRHHGGTHRRGRSNYCCAPRRRAWRASMIRLADMR